MQQTQKQQTQPSPRQRQTRVDREHANEVQKIEIAGFDIDSVEINTRILNKIQRKIQRRK